MKILVKKVTASTNMTDNSPMYTPSDILELLTQIEGLSGYEISLAQDIDGDLQYIVGDSTYKIVDKKNRICK